MRFNLAMLPAGLGWFVTIGIVLMMASALWFDRAITDYFIRLAWQDDTVWLHDSGQIIAFLGKPDLWLLIFIPWWLWIWRRQPDVRLRETLPAQALLGMLLSTFFVRIIKLVASRHRPTDLIYEKLYGFTWSFDSSLSSFPSGHACMITTVMICCALHYPRWRYVFYLMGFIISMARVVQLKHYMSDIIAGVLIGTVCATWIYRYFSCATPKTYSRSNAGDSQ